MGDVTEYYKEDDDYRCGCHVAYTAAADRLACNCITMLFLILLVFVDVCEPTNCIQYKVRARPLVTGSPPLRKQKFS